MGFKRLGLNFTAIAGGVVATEVGWAAQYLTIEEAQKLFFANADRFEGIDLELTLQQAKEVEDLTDVLVKSRKVTAWRAHKKSGEVLGLVWKDQVLGKNQMIDFAVSILPDGKIGGLEILEFRETHGSQVKDLEWRKQFVGKRVEDSLRWNKEIKNISGATLSCKHLIEGVRRILKTHDLVFKKTT